MILGTKKVILWLPALILAGAALVVAIILLTNNAKRLNNLEDSQNQTTITFTFNQGATRFRIICNSNPANPNLYLCSTVASGPAPKPTPTPTIVKPGG